MKKIVSSLLILFLIVSDLSAQINLIPNPGFENGVNSPQCNYSYPNYIENDIYYWKTATCNGLAPFYTCKYAYSAPDWHGSVFSCTGNPFSYSRHIYIEEDERSGHQDAIMTSLFAHMVASQNYVFKIIYATGNRKSTIQPSNGNPRVTVWLTKYSTHWSSNWGNTKLSFDMYPPGPNAGWVQHWVILPFAIIPVNSNYLNSLNNIVLDCAVNHAYKDYVELSENCANPMLISNHTFTPLVQELPYKSGGVLRAGYNVGSYSGLGNVVVSSQSSVTFKAASQIFLEPGFIAEPNSTFKTIIEPCDINTAKTMPDTIEIIDEKTIRIGEITIYDDSHETLACGDTLQIFGLDGDTTSFVSYFWDFGNGVTSNNPVATIFYNKSGDYLVKLVLTDSSGVTDTLSKTYTVPDCQRVKSSNPNNDFAPTFTIYPNPTEGKIKIEFEGTIDELIKIELFNSLGQMVFVENNAQRELYIDISSFPKGVYFLTGTFGKSVISNKIILK